MEFKRYILIKEYSWKEYFNHIYLVFEKILIEEINLFLLFFFRISIKFCE